MSSYDQMLQKALLAQEEDLEVGSRITNTTSKPEHRAVQVAVPEDVKKAAIALLQLRAPSLQQVEHARLAQMAEVARREVMKQEISSIHCSGTRDRNTR